MWISMPPCVLDTSMAGKISSRPFAARRASAIPAVASWSAMAMMSRRPATAASTTSEGERAPSETVEWTCRSMRTCCQPLRSARRDAPAPPPRKPDADGVVIAQSDAEAEQQRPVDLEIDAEGRRERELGFGLVVRGEDVQPHARHDVGEEDEPARREHAADAEPGRDAEERPVVHRGADAE